MWHLLLTRSCPLETHWLMMLRTAQHEWHKHRQHCLSCQQMHMRKRLAASTSTEHTPSPASTLIPASCRNLASRHNRCSAQARASGLAGAERAKTHSWSTRNPPCNLAASHGEAAGEAAMMAAHLALPWCAVWLASSLRSLPPFQISRPES